MTVGPNTAPWWVSTQGAGRALLQGRRAYSRVYGLAYARQECDEGDVAHGFIDEPLVVHQREFDFRRALPQHEFVERLKMLTGFEQRKRSGCRQAGPLCSQRLSCDSRTAVQFR